MSGSVRTWSHAALLCVLIAGTYANSLSGTFQYDDGHSIVRNAHLRDLGNVPAFFVDPSLFSGDADKRMYRPIVLTSLALNHALHGYSAVGYHLVNVVLHGIAVLLLWSVAGLFINARRALLAGVLFALHPLASEPVNYISSRSELLLALFCLLAVYAHVRSVQQRSAGWRVGAIVAVGLALLSKATAVMLAPILLAIDLWAVGWCPRSAGEAGRRHGGYWLATILYLAIVVGNGFVGGSLAAPVRDFSTQWLTQLKAPAYYARLFIVPTPLSVEHAFSESANLSVTVLMAAALLGSLVWCVWAGRTRWRAAWTTVVVTALVLLPTSAMPLNVLVNERRVYLVLAVLAVLFAGSVRRVRGWPALLWVVLAASLTVQRNEVWATPVTLWEAAVEDGSRSYRVMMNLGQAYQQDGRKQEALAAYQEALRLDDRHGDVYNNLAVLLHEEGRLLEAVERYQEAIRRYPQMEEIRLNLADAYLHLGRPADAAATFAQALQMDQDNGGAWNNYGDLLIRLRRWDDAVTAFRRAVDLLPGRIEPLNGLGNALDGAGQRQAAARAYRDALRLDGEPGVRAVVHANLGETLHRLGHADAQVHLDSSIQLQPSASAFDYRGRLAAADGRREAARQDWQRAVELDSTRGTAWTGLGEMSLKAEDAAQAIAQFQRALRYGGGGRARWGLALAYEQADMLAEARQLLGEIASDTADPRAGAARRRLEAFK